MRENLSPKIKRPCRQKIGNIEFMLEDLGEDAYPRYAVRVFRIEKYAGPGRPIEIMRLSQWGPKDMDKAIQWMEKARKWVERR